jgi:hypothetical protein
MGAIVNPGRHPSDWGNEGILGSVILISGRYCDGTNVRDVNGEESI